MITVKDILGSYITNTEGPSKKIIKVRKANNIFEHTPTEYDYILVVEGDEKNYTVEELNILVWPKELDLEKY